MRATSTRCRSTGRRGPRASYAYPDAGYYKGVDLTDPLTAGENAVGALHNWNGEGQGRPAAEPGLLVRVDATLADGTEVTVGRTFAFAAGKRG